MGKKNKVASDTNIWVFITLNKKRDCTLTAKADIIVSGDKHLTELGKYKKTKIFTPREFFDSIA
jgi:hypothetical protein